MSNETPMAELNGWAKEDACNLSRRVDLPLLR